MKTKPFAMWVFIQQSKINNQQLQIENRQISH